MSCISFLLEKGAVLIRSMNINKKRIISSIGLIAAWTAISVCAISDRSDSAGDTSVRRLFSLYETNIPKRPVYVGAVEQSKEGLQMIPGYTDAFQNDLVYRNTKQVFSLEDEQIGIMLSNAKELKDEKELEGYWVLDVKGKTLKEVTGQIDEDGNLIYFPSKKGTYVFIGQKTDGTYWALNDYCQLKAK